MEFKFVKLAGVWFIHLPDFEAGVEELAMVDYAHTFLEYLNSFHNTGIITLGISILPTEYFCKLTLIESDDSGATYEVETKFDQIPVKTIWLCNVTKYVFGEFPENFYIKLS